MRKKVLIVDDSAFMRKLIHDFISEHPLLEPVGFARNGMDAIEKIKLLQPDVVSMDVEMPILNGIDALKQIMKECPVPVIMLSSTTTTGTENTVLAMSHGAVDFIAKPSGTISLDLYKVKEEIVAKLVEASKIQISKLHANHSSLLPKKILNQNVSTDRKVYNKLKPTTRQSKTQKIICIGTSTGGPRALQQVLTSLPKGIPAPIVVVQHMPAGFTRSLAQRLDSLSQIEIKEAEDGEVLQQGIAYIAPGGYHLKVRKMESRLAVSLDKIEAQRNGHRPSVDVMFESISEIRNFDKIAVIMTGMGSDGAQGLIKLKRSGSVKAIAESQATSIVYGMPKAAVSTNMIDDIEPLNHIADAIMKYMP
ncbi:protein-glutamate methylesterase/protein-glutamine glutaminase [Bacillus sp. 2205SS5-2]|uniref:protein-glutamate methylesterase/protein-glutamine glutaminase n=1 Tax=Bacillus sp. 2205SS5-2 TaxID=3109031 RepID=UPI0030063CD5